MPIKTGSARKIALDMTPMIDVVFQLLTFFIMTLKIGSPEGDFAIQMPGEPKAGQPVVSSLPPMTLALRAAEDGSCREVALNGRTFHGAGRWDDLHTHLVRLIGEGDARADVKLRLACDERLNYEHAIEAITAVSGSLDERGRIVPLVERIEFVDAK